MGFNDLSKLLGSEGLVSVAVARLCICALHRGFIGHLPRLVGKFEGPAIWRNNFPYVSGVKQDARPGTNSCPPPTFPTRLSGDT